jgi:release factor glutamine methyltransferase
LAALAPEVRDHDPRGALEGGPDGLAAYRRIVPGLRKALRPGGFALFEVGPDQAQAVLRLLAEAGLDAGEGQNLWRDLAGRPRVVGGLARG